MQDRRCAIIRMITKENDPSISLVHMIGLMTKQGRRGGKRVGAAAAVMAVPGLGHRFKFTIKPSNWAKGANTTWTRSASALQAKPSPHTLTPAALLASLPSSLDLSLQSTESSATFSRFRLRKSRMKCVEYVQRRRASSPMTSQFPIPDLNGLNPEVFHPSQTWQAQYLINNRQTHSKALTFAAVMPPSHGLRAALGRVLLNFGYG